MNRWLAAAAETARAARQPSDLDCCVYARDVIRRRYDLPEPGDELQALWLIWLDDDGLVPLDRTWGPCEAAVRTGLAASWSFARAAPTTQAWHVCQGWSAVGPSGRVDPRSALGHTWLWRPEDPLSGVGTAIESSRTEGPRWGGPDHWSARAARYPGGIAVAALRVAVR